MITLKSDSLIIRYCKESDLADFHKMMSDKDNMYYLPELITNSIEESQKSLTSSIKANEKGDCHRFCIILKENNELIGSVGYEIPYNTPVGKIADPIGWFIMPPYQNKGYMTEAVKRVLEFAFLQDNCIRVVTACYKDNIPTQKVMAKVGFRKEAEKIEAMWHDGQMKDRLEFAINKNEFMQRN